MDMALRNEAADLRDSLAGKRDAVATGLDDRAAVQDELARRRDEDGSKRDVRGDQRDTRAHLRLVRSYDHPRTDGWPTEIRTEFGLLAKAVIEERAYAERDRRSAAVDRNNARFDRTSALADRLIASRCRLGSEADRGGSQQDRQHSASDRHDAAFDGLSGAYSREAGLIELNREVLRAHETGGLLAVGYVHLDSLEIGQYHGDYAAVDRDMADVVGFLRPFFKRYDIIVRMSSEQLLCVLTGYDSAAVTERFEQIRVGLAQATPAPVLARIGFAILGAHDSPTVLVRRAFVAALAEGGNAAATPAAIS